MHLKPEELKLASDLGNCFNQFAKLRREICNELAPGCDWMDQTAARNAAQQDINEFAMTIHHLQNAVMAFAAQRGHPGVFRP